MFPRQVPIGASNAREEGTTACDDFFTVDCDTGCAHGFGAQRSASRPTSAPASTSNAGLIRVRTTIANTLNAISAVTQPLTAPFANVRQPATSRPTETGVSPRLSVTIQGRLRRRVQRRPTTSASTAGGPKNAKNTTTAPGRPAVNDPIDTTTIMFGPGAAWPTPNMWPS